MHLCELGHSGIEAAVWGRPDQERTEGISTNYLPYKSWLHSILLHAQNSLNGTQTSSTWVREPVTLEGVRSETVGTDLDEDQDNSKSCFIGFYTTLFE